MWERFVARSRRRNIGANHQIKNNSNKNKEQERCGERHFIIIIIIIIRYGCLLSQAFSSLYFS